MKKFVLVSLIIILCIIIIAVSYYLFFKPVNNTSTGGVATPTLSPSSYGPAEATNDRPVTVNEKTILKQEAAVGDLLGKLPYVGKNFSLYFNYQLNQFVLYINPKNKTDGENEFNSFLTSNGIQNKGWLQNIFTTYITPTPTAIRKLQKISPTLAP